MFVSLLDAYSLVLCAAAFLSWTGSASVHVVARAVRKLTEPVLAPVRRTVPSSVSWDVAPLVAFVVLRVLRALVVRL